MRTLITLLILTLPLRAQAPLPDAPTSTRVITKPWLAAHAAYLGAVTFDVEMTHEGIAHHHCVERNTMLPLRPSRGELYRDGLIEFSLLTAFDLLFKAAGPPRAFAWVPYMGAAYGSTVHIKGGLTWATQCW